LIGRFKENVMPAHRCALSSGARPFVLTALGLAVAGAAWAQDTGARQEPGSADWKALDRIMGREGKLQPGGVYKYGFPRADLRVEAGGVTLKPALALGSWVAFKGTDTDAMAMGDLVLLETEVSPVLAKLQQMGVQATALHNHILHESPRVMYLHIEGRGDPAKVAQAVHDALALTKTPPAGPVSGGAGSPFSLDTAGIAATLGHEGKVNGGVYQVTVPRVEAVRVDGMEVPPSMGVATALNFQPTAGGKAAIAGDFVMTASEVNPVIQALREAGIEVTALHSHMLTDEPRLFFLHFWANDDALKLARGLRAALDRTNSAKAAF
jgi:hypothetical protein